MSPKTFGWKGWKDGLALGLAMYVTAVFKSLWKRQKSRYLGILRLSKISFFLLGETS
jgi:hypothetical protein